MKLNLIERFTILNLLPKETNFATLKIVRELQKVLSTSEEEFKKYEIKQVEDKITWNVKGNEEVEIKIGEKATDIIVEELKKLDNEKKLTKQHLSVYDKFIGG